MIVGGAITVFVGLALTWVFFAAGVHVAMATRDPSTDKVNNVGTANWVPLTLTLTALGAILVFAGLLYGGVFHRRGFAGTPSTTEYFKIIAKFGTDRDGTLLAADWQMEGQERLRYYIRAMLPDGTVDEFETSEIVFWQCGEGMVGQAQTQGRWLGAFVPYVGTPQP